MHITTLLFIFEMVVIDSYFYSFFPFCLFSFFHFFIFFLLPSFSLLLTISMINFVWVVSPIVTVQLERTKSRAGGPSPSVNWLTWSLNDATSV